MKTKTKTEADSLLRVPKAKNKLGLKIHKIAMPHDDLIRADDTSHFELVEKDTLPSQSSLPSQTTLTRQTKEIAPIRDFQKTPNSITRQAIPEGLFKGKSKQLYDALYSLTRGAITPVRHTRIRKSKLMKLANIGSRATFDSNINHLQSIGLISETVLPGEHEGNKFEVFLPEEMLGLPSQPSQPRHAQKPVSLVSLETSQTRQSSKPTNIDVLEKPKTSFKDIENNDDEAFASMLKVFKKMSEKISGKSANKNQKQNWEELALLLQMELEIAAARTKSISNVPAFLTEHLRRRLLGKSNPAKPSDIKSKSGGTLQAGKSGSTEENTVEEYLAEPLTDQGREAVLRTMQQYIEKGQKEFVMSQQDTFTEEDWEWLTKQLKQENSTKQP